MEIDESIKEAERLIAQRREIDAKLAALFGGQAPERKERKCSGCGSTEHSLRTCPDRRQLAAIAAE